MKKLFLMAAALCTATAFAQTGNVGINTTTPTNTLDVNGTARVRNLPLNNSPAYFLVADANGVLGNNPANFVQAAQSIAATNVDVAFQIPASNSTDPNIYSIPLNISNTITIPAGAKYGVLTTYSVPCGFSTTAGNVVETAASDTAYALMTTAGVQVTTSNKTTRPVNYPGYIGITFFKDGIQVDGPTRKVNIPPRATDRYYQQTTIAAQYYEEIDNSTGSSALATTYGLNGYLEIQSFTTGSIEAGKVTSGTARFNMWDAGKNYNWGRGSMTSMIYRIK